MTVAKTTPRRLGELDKNMINTLTQGELISIIETLGLDQDSYRSDVLNLSINQELFGQQEAGKDSLLGLVDRVIAGMLKAYATRGATVSSSYGGSIRVTVWSTVEAMRSSMGYHAERDRERMTEETD